MSHIPELNITVHLMSLSGQPLAGALWDLSASFRLMNQEEQENVIAAFEEHVSKEMEDDFIHTEAFAAWIDMHLTKVTSPTVAPLLHLGTAINDIRDAEDDGHPVELFMSSTYPAAVRDQHWPTFLENMARLASSHDATLLGEQEPGKQPAQPGASL